MHELANPLDWAGDESLPDEAASPSQPVTLSILVIESILLADRPAKPRRRVVNAKKNDSCIPGPETDPSRQLGLSGWSSRLSSESQSGMVQVVSLYIDSSSLASGQSTAGTCSTITAPVMGLAVMDADLVFPWLRKGGTCSVFGDRKFEFAPLLGGAHRMAAEVAYGTVFPPLADHASIPPRYQYTLV